VTYSASAVKIAHHNKQPGAVYIHYMHGLLGADVMISKIISPKKLAKKLAFYIQNTATFAEIGENRRKL
jgi:hypothetical protein